MSPSSAAAARIPTRAQEAIRVLVVDDDQLQARLLKANLDRPGRFQVELVSSGEEALRYVTRNIVDAVLTDLLMPGMDGLAVLRALRDSDPALPVFLMTGNATLERAVEGIRSGATDFLQKPLNVSAVAALIQRAVAERPLREEVKEAQVRRATVARGSVVLGSHPRLDAVRVLAQQLAQTPSRVLITGESGTGKSLLARMIHDLSGASGRFIEVNCAAIPGQLLESELFGHEKGAFTDARTLKRGLIEAADRGTLFLDEIGMLPLELQAKLLQFLENREVRRIGGLEPIPVHTRVIAATNEDLQASIRERTFRQDLFYRRHVAAVELPPLREIPEVIAELAEHFTRELCLELQRPVPELTEGSFARLADYSWPGNTRELRNAIERALIVHPSGPFLVSPPVEPPHLRGTTAPPGVLMEPGLTLEEVERRYILFVLERARGEDLEAIARRLGISRKTLWDKRRRYQPPSDPATG